MIDSLFDCFPAAALAAAVPRLPTLLAVRPELRHRLPVPERVEHMLGIYREGRLRSWSLRVAHLIVDFLLDCLARAGAGSVEIRLLDTTQADPLDREWLAVLADRAPPELVAVVAGDAPGSSEAAEYESLSSEARKALHRARAEELESRGEPSLLIGAIPFHREREGADASALAAASRQCMHLSYYAAALDWSERTCALAERLGDQRSRNEALRDRIFALLMLDRLDEAEALSERCIEQIDDARLHVHSYYAQALLHLRLRAQRDPARGRASAERAIEAARQVPPSGERTAALGFLHNTLALVKLREGDAAAALQMVTDAIETVRNEAPECFAEEAMILYHNRARLHLAAGRDGEALADLDRLLALVPGVAEAWADRAAIRARAGQTAQAIADYGEALYWAPPQPATLQARAALLAESGRHREALADYDAALARAPDDARLHCLRGLMLLAERRDDEAEAAFVRAIDLAPDLADAWANRATVHCRCGAFDRALADLDRALALRDDPVIRRNREKVLAARASWSRGGEGRSQRNTRDKDRV